MMRQSDRITAGFLFGLLALPLGSAAQTFTNPIVGRGADPWAIQYKGQYFYTRTSSNEVRVARSPWLQSLNTNASQVWNPPAGEAYSQQTWAPELHRLNEKWYLYVAADDGDDANHRMFVLEGDSQDPQGSYTLKGQISIPANRWAIDGTVFEHSGKDYFIWSGRTSGTTTDIGNSQSLYIAEMENPWTLTGTRTRISNPTLSWERHGHPVNEGPTIIKNGNDVFLTYSASGFYTPEYAIGALRLTGSNPLLASAWTKHSQPLFDQGNGVEGTGHASFVKSPDGTENWIVYHARKAPDAARDVRIQPFTFGGDGLPVFGEPVASGEPIQNPSGIPLVTFIPNLSFERGGAGWLEDFRAFGDAGAIDNDGETFDTIAGADGKRVGYLGAGVNSGIYQDIGPVHAGEYTLSVDLAISGDQAALAEASQQFFILRLESVGLHPGGSANEALREVLAEITIDSSELTADIFKNFDVTAVVSDKALIGTWLRVGLYAPDDTASGTSTWQVTLDSMRLEFSAFPAEQVPEPAGLGVLIGSGLVLSRRRPAFRA